MTEERPPAFSATLLHTEHETPVVSAFGEIDISSVQELRAVINSAISRLGGQGRRTGSPGGSACFILDLGGVEFMDSTGVAALIEGRNELLKATGAVPAVVCTRAVREVLEVTGLAGSFDLYDDLESATAECSGDGGRK